MQGKGKETKRCMEWREILLAQLAGLSDGLREGGKRGGGRTLQAGRASPVALKTRELLRAMPR